MIYKNQMLRKQTQTNPNKPNFTRESPFFKPFGQKRSKLLPDVPFAGTIRGMRKAEDFMFQLNKEEFKNLKFHFGTSSWGGSPQCWK